MKRISVALVLLASLAMIPALFMPLWDIQLSAPQYPEGLGMQIWLDHIGGEVKIISNLNHYIGMKPIEDSMFPEFKYMKAIMIFFIASGVGVALLRVKQVYVVWFLLFLVTAAFGIYDFWSWEYDYGHNLDPRAAIIIPGMAYQPPLFGCKDLLNFNACSFPASGGILIMAAGTLCFFVFISELFLKKTTSIQEAPEPVARMSAT